MKISRDYLKKIISEEIKKVIKEMDWDKAEREFDADDPRQDYEQGGDDEGAERFSTSEPKEDFKTEATKSLFEYPTGGPGRPHKKYTDGTPKPELQGKKYSEKVEIWKESDPEWGDWYDKNMDILQKQKEGSKERPDQNFRDWTASWNTKSKFKGK